MYGLCGFLLPLSHFLCLFQDLLSIRLRLPWIFLSHKINCKPVALDTYMTKSEIWWFDWWTESKCQHLVVVLFLPLLSSITPKTVCLSLLFKIEEEYKWKIKDINSASQITAVSPNISDLNADIFLGNLLEFPC